MPREGFEPTHPCGRQLLKLVRPTPMPPTGFEPVRVSPHGSKPCAYANSATEALVRGKSADSSIAKSLLRVSPPRRTTPRHSYTLPKIKENTNPRGWAGICVLLSSRTLQQVQGKLREGSRAFQNTEYLRDSSSQQVGTRNDGGGDIDRVYGY